MADKDSRSNIHTRRACGLDTRWLRRTAGLQKMEIGNCGGGVPRSSCAAQEERREGPVLGEHGLVRGAHILDVDSWLWLEFLPWKWTVVGERGGSMGECPWWLEWEKKRRGRVPWCRREFMGVGNWAGTRTAARVVGQRHASTCCPDLLIELPQRAGTSIKHHQLAWQK